MQVSDEMVAKAIDAMSKQDITFAHCEPSWQEKAIRATLEAALWQAKDNLAYNEAKQLATYLHRQHYADSAPNWKPLSDIRGVISQIDNMVCGLVRKQER